MPIVDEVISLGVALAGLFGKSAKDIKADSFIDSLVAASQQMGHTGYTHDDVVHLMPGQWYENQTNAANVFDYYLGIGDGRNLGTTKGTLSEPLKPGIDYSSYLDFSGDYTPGHPIVYNGIQKKPEKLSPTTTISGQNIQNYYSIPSIGGTSNPSIGTTTPGAVAVKSNTTIFIMIGTLIVILVLFKKK